MRRLAAVLLFSLFIAPAGFAKNLYIPVAGFSPGANGTFWRTDVRIHNPSAVDDIEVTLHFLPAGMDGRNIPGRVFQIRRREVLVLENVVATLAPDPTAALGAIRIDSDTDRSYEFIAISRTYTTSPNPQQRGTYGQFVPALDPAVATERSVILNVAQRPDVRANIGAMNPGQTEIALRARLVGFDGTPFLESAELVLPPKSMRQWSLTELFGELYTYEAYVVIEASEPLFTWASVIDNHSGDGIFVQGIEPVPER